jgi:putative exosortase-associated protein (TIGR04073 family)
MNLKRTLLIVTVLMAVGLMNYSVGAVDFNSYNENDLPPVRKLSRGIVNVAIGALEIPMNMIDTNEEEGGVAAVVYGTLKGFCLCIAREVVGVVEIVTFLMPLPGATVDKRESGWGYGPILRPEWVVDKEHDWYNFVYPDYPPQ